MENLDLSCHVLNFNVLVLKPILVPIPEQYFGFLGFFLLLLSLFKPDLRMTHSSLDIKTIHFPARRTPAASLRTDPTSLWLKPISALIVIVQLELYWHIFYGLSCYFTVILTGLFDKTKIAREKKNQRVRVYCQLTGTCGSILLWDIRP